MAADNYDLQVDIGKRIFLEYDQEVMIRKFGLDSDEKYIYLTYLNTPCRICRESGGIEEQHWGQWQACRDFTTVMMLYDLLCYHKGESPPVLLHQWCTVGNFVITGVTQTDTFTGKYARLFDGRMAELKAACKMLGGVIQPPMAGADLTCRFPVMPFFPVLLQFWEGDEEFPPKILILWDRNADQFLHFETTFYLQGDLLSRLKRCMEVCV